MYVPADDDVFPNQRAHQCCSYITTGYHTSALVFNKGLNTYLITSSHHYHYYYYYSRENNVLHLKAPLAMLGMKKGRRFLNFKCSFIHTAPEVGFQFLFFQF